MAFSPAVDYDIPYLKGIENRSFLGEGLFLAERREPEVVISSCCSPRADIMFAAPRFQVQGETNWVASIAGDIFKGYFSGLLRRGSPQSLMQGLTALILRQPIIFCIFFVLIDFFVSPFTQAVAAESGNEELLAGQPIIHLLKPDNRGGKAYKLVYLVDAPIDVYWNFKTDFDSDFLLTHEYIDEHRFIRRQKNIVITENVYSNVPNATFRWRTTLYPSTYRLEFTLVNPEACGQKFHYGYIQLSALNQYTKVTHVAYFDFLGVSLWAYYPWKGGMSAFLEYTAKWEQEMISLLKERYKAVDSGQAVKKSKE